METNVKVVGDWVCFSPPGPGQCQYRPETAGHGEHHDVVEPSSLYLVGISLVVAYLFLRPKSR